MPNRKTRLANRATRAHARALKRGDTQVGTRRSPSSPRTLTSGTIPVYKREQKILNKIKKVGDKPPKGPKQSLIGRLKDGLRVRSGGIGKNKKSKAEKAKCNFTNKRNNQRQRRRDTSCK